MFGCIKFTKFLCLKWPKHHLHQQPQRCIQTTIMLWAKKKKGKKKFRTERDSFGDIKVPADRLYGAQTMRALQHFKIGSSNEKLPLPIIQGMAIVKKACANVNIQFGMKKEIGEAISCACDDIISGKFSKKGHLPLVNWQTNTQTNMCINEVIANAVNQMLGGKLGSQKPCHPNDHVNLSQSSNDTYPSAIHICTAMEIRDRLIPCVTRLRDSLKCKSKDWKKIYKTGRTHTMDALPLTLGQEFGCFAHQLTAGMERVKSTLPRLYEIPIGGTAVGTGYTTYKGFAEKVSKRIAELTKLPFKTSRNLFESINADDTLVEVHGALNVLAVSLQKITNDIRFLASGPRCGISEIMLPENEPGSSIMPGKVNPTQCDVFSMICAQVIGNNIAVTLGGCGGHFQLSVMKPVMIVNLLQSIRLISDGCVSFSKNCVEGIKPHKKNIKKTLNESLMLVTALNKHIGYDKAASIAKAAHKNGTTLQKEAVKAGISEADFKKWVDPKKMVSPAKYKKEKKD